MTVASAEPSHGCPLCPRLVAYRRENTDREPTWFNGPAPSFGDESARLLVVGLAPGRTGANRTGRPFTGDFAGDLLYATLARHGWSAGTYNARTDDGLSLKGAMITNAVRCAPPENKPTPVEIATCNRFLVARMDALPRLAVLIALGKVAHDAVLKAKGERLSAFVFKHGARHALKGGVTLIDSYHCSRYNQNTGRLTAPMFDDVFKLARAEIDAI
jgi:uracil-DNA glycosylase